MAVSVASQTVFFSSCFFCSLAFRNHGMNVVQIAIKEAKERESEAEANLFKTIRNVLRAIYDANASHAAVDRLINESDIMER